MKPTCQYAFPGTYGHECGAPATSVLVTKRTAEVTTALRCMGVKPSEDGLSRAGRCDKHRAVREPGDGAYVSTEVTK